MAGSTDIESLEAELRRQLEDLDSIVGGEDFASSYREGPNVFELAAAEGEKEALHDRLQTLLARSEDFESQQAVLRDLTMRNEELLRENTVLKKFREDFIEDFNARQQTPQQKATPDSASLEEKYKELEFRLAETRSKLARAQQSQDDHLLARELAEKRLEQEKLAKSHAEKERDAYASAYEASLKHFERWSERKIGTGQGAVRAEAGTTTD